MDELGFNLRIMSATTPYFTAIDTINDVLAKQVENADLSWRDPFQSIQAELTIRIMAVFATFLATLAVTFLSLPAFIALNLRSSQGKEFRASDFIEFTLGFVEVTLVATCAPIAAIFMPHSVYKVWRLHENIQDYKENVIDRIEFEYPIN